MSPPPYLVRTPTGGKWDAHIPNHRNHWQGYNHHNHNHHESTMRFGWQAVASKMHHTMDEIYTFTMILL
jgi:hypothetical protein